MSISKHILPSDGGSDDSWYTVSRRYPCPICHKPDWCSATGQNDSPDAVVCMREPSDNQRPNGGWLHRLRDTNDWVPDPSNKKASTSTKQSQPWDTGSNVDKPTAKTFSSADELLAAWEVRLGKPSALYEYENEQGELIGLVARWDQMTQEGAANGKTIRQASRQTDGRWAHKAMPNPKPLYRLPSLMASKGPIYLVEGEKCVDYLASIGIHATTWPGGSSAAVKADITPLAGRDLVLLADNDEPGRKAMDILIDRLATLSTHPTIRRIDLPNLPEKGDVVDWIEAHGDAAEPETIATNLNRLATEAVVVKLPDVERPLRWQPMPTDALPEPLRSFVTEGAKAIGCDASYLAMPLLAAVASAIGTTRCLQVKRGWNVPAILWTVIVGESGSSKTPAFNLAIRPLHIRQRKTIEKNMEAQKSYLEDLAKYEKSIAIWKRDQTTSNPPLIKPDPPQAERCLVSDTTIEALAPLLLANPRGLLISCDELSGWFGSFDRYAIGKGGDSAQWLKMYNGSDLIIDRKTGSPRTISIPSASVSITGGIQPGILQKSLVEEHRESGLAARLLLVYPPRKAKQWTESEIAPRTEQRIIDLIEQLFLLEATTNVAGEPCPLILTLTAEAKAAWVAYINQHGQEQIGLEGDLSAAWSKLEEIPARLALIFHLISQAMGDLAADGSEDNLIGIESMKAAIRLAEWFKYETRRIYPVLNESPSDREQRQLIEWIERRGGTTTVRDVQQGYRRLKGTGQAEQALRKLVEASIGAWQEIPPGPKGGRPSSLFVLNEHLTSTKPPETGE